MDELEWFTFIAGKKSSCSGRADQSYVPSKALALLPYYTARLRDSGPAGTVIRAPRAHEHEHNATAVGLIGEIELPVNGGWGLRSRLPCSHTPFKISVDNKYTCTSTPGTDTVQPDTTGSDRGG